MGAASGLAESMVGILEERAQHPESPALTLDLCALTCADSDVESRSIRPFDCPAGTSLVAAPEAVVCGGASCLVTECCEAVLDSDTSEPTTFADVEAMAERILGRWAPTIESDCDTEVGEAAERCKGPTSEPTLCTISTDAFQPPLAQVPLKRWSQDSMRMLAACLHSRRCKFVTTSHAPTRH